MGHFINPLTEPVGALWALTVLGMVWLLWHRHWRSAFWLGLPTLVLFVIGSTPLPEILVAREERQWVGSTDAGLLDQGTTGPWDHKTTDLFAVASAKAERSKPRDTKALAPYDAVVALGGGERVSQHDLLGFAVSDGYSRNLTVIELVRSGQAKTLVLGGSCDALPGQPDVPSMQAVQDWVVDWGLVPYDAVTNLGLCRNTHDEAVAFRKLARSRGWSKVILVTSALHLRRAVALFKKQGIEVTPVAADFQVMGVPQDPFSPFPREHRLFLLTLYLHEKIGWAVYRARGWI